MLDNKHYLQNYIYLFNNYSDNNHIAVLLTCILIYLLRIFLVCFHYFFYTDINIDTICKSDIAITVIIIKKVILYL